MGPERVNSSCIALRTVSSTLSTLGTQTRGDQGCVWHPGLAVETGFWGSWPQLSLTDKVRSVSKLSQGCRFFRDVALHAE